ncbi:hypothetical protein KFE94_14930 [bacterium SCSIO 12643]|nr:hypothetical protein KFE94_14930 [bacterium SCSIO 12643]
MRIFFLDITKAVVFVGAMFFVAGCGSESTNGGEENSDSEKAEEVITYTPETLLKEIQEMEKSLENPTIPQKRELTEQLVEFYLSYADLFPKNPMAGDMVFKAGNQSVNLEKFDDALAHYDRIDKYFQTYQKRPESIYLQGFIYDTYKDEFGKAKEKYERLILLYPNHVLAEQAKQSIAHLGMSDEDIIRSFEKNSANN